MNPAIRTNSQIAVSIIQESVLVGRGVIEKLGRRSWERDPTNTHSPLSRQAALRLAGTLHRALYLRTDGRIGGRLRGGSVLLLTTTGRKTGQARTRPVSYLHDGDDIVLVASAAGAPYHPAWYLNLLANPRVRIQQGGVTRTMVARSVDGSERARLWERIVQRYPVAAEYQRRTGREFPVVILRPVRAAEPRTTANPTLTANEVSQLPTRLSAAA